MPTSHSSTEAVARTSNNGWKQDVVVRTERLVQVQNPTALAQSCRQVYAECSLFATERAIFEIGCQTEPATIQHREFMNANQIEDVDGEERGGFRGHRNWGQGDSGESA
jgi:hypothetical protein